VRKNGIRGTSIHKKTPHRELVNQMDQLAGGDGVDPTPGY
jgi:hypothetical protein